MIFRVLWLVMLTTKLRLVNLSTSSLRQILSLPRARKDVAREWMTHLMNRSLVKRKLMKLQVRCRKYRVSVTKILPNLNDLNLNRAQSSVSKQSRRSTATSKTYISKLEKQLEAEKIARLKLEQEVEEMKKINAEISSKLGLSNASGK